jgi:hypothetical protein
MDPEVAAYVAGLEEKMKKMTPAQRRKLISSIRQKAQEAGKVATPKA